MLFEKFKNLNESDFQRKYTNYASEQDIIDQETINTIYKSMHKHTENQRHVDCQSCGYKTCDEMVQAIALGYNNIGNCVQYEKDENLILFTKDKITRLPNMSVFISDMEKIIQSKNTDIAIIQFNIKDFTLINKRLGFETGNSVLRDFSSEALKQIKEHEKLYHTGGDSLDRKSVV